MNSILKKVFLLLFSLILSFPAFSQEAEEDASYEAGKAEDIELEETDESAESSNKKASSSNTSNSQVSTKDEMPQYKTLPYGFYIGAKFALNKIDNEDKTLPFVATATGGFEYEYKVKHFALQPSFDLSFFHYLWTGSIAAHAENENRTALTITFNAELPFMLSFDIQRWSISFGTSFALLARVSTLDLGVKASESLDEEGITAKEEVTAINKYHWQSGKFFYPAIRFKTEYTLENGWKAGVLFSTYLPIFNAWSEKIANTPSGKVPFLHDSIFTLAIVMHPGKKL